VRESSGSARAAHGPLRASPPRSASVAAPPDEPAVVDPGPVAGPTRAPRRRLPTRPTNGNAGSPAAWPTPDASEAHNGTGTVDGPATVAAPVTSGSLVPRRDDETSSPGTLRPANWLGLGQPNPFANGQTAGLTDGAVGPAWPAHPAGAYLPPSAVFGPRPAQRPIAGALRARQGAAAADPTARDNELGWLSGAEPAPAAAGTAAPASPGARVDEGLFANLAVDVPTTVADWLVAAGSGVAAIGFLLPWSENVIGAKGIGTYLDTWGLASPPNFIVFLLAMGALALTVIPNRVPVWVRTGTLGMLLGGILLGLVWPYLVGGWAGGAQIGVLGETVASALLMAGGLLVQRAMRHGGVAPAV
jgi:hypothetical protein